MPASSSRRRAMSASRPVSNDRKASQLSRALIIDLSSWSQKHLPAGLAHPGRRIASGRVQHHRSTGREPHVDREASGRSAGYARGCWAARNRGNHAELSHLTDNLPAGVRLWECLPMVFSFGECRLRCNALRFGGVQREPRQRPGSGKHGLGVVG
jgi:hypothetical protein